MERMNKISKYLDSIGVNYRFCSNVRKSLIGGRSFYNDGIFYEDIYDLGDDYKLGVKVSGRPEFYLYKNHQLIRVLGFSQDEAIASLKIIFWEIGGTSHDRYRKNHNQEYQKPCK